MLPFLVNQEGDENSEEEAAWALACLAGVQSNAPSITDAGALPLLLRLSSSPNPSVQVQAFWALANLAVVDDVKHELQALGAVPVLVRHLDDLLKAGDDSRAGALQQVPLDLPHLPPLHSRIPPKSLTPPLTPRPAPLTGDPVPRQPPRGR